MRRGLEMVLRMMVMLLMMMNGISMSFGEEPTRKHPYFVVDLAISPDGRYIAEGRMDLKLIVWDREEKKLVFGIEGKKGAEVNMQSGFTQDSKYFVFQDRSLDLIFLDIEKKKVAMRYHLDAEFGDIAFFKDGKRFIWGGDDGRIEYVDMEKNEKKVLKKPDPYSSSGLGGREIIDIEISPDETKFISTTYIRPFERKEEPEEDFAPYNAKRWIIKYHGLNVWDAVELKRIAKLTAGESMGGRCWPVFSPDGQKVLAGTEYDWVNIWNASDGLWIYKSDRVHAKSVGYVDSDGKYFVTLSSGLNSLRLLETSSSKIIKKPGLEYEPVFGQLRTLPSQNLVVTGDTDGSISVYRFNPEDQTLRLIWHPKPVKSGIIEWISPLDLMEKSREEARQMYNAYIEEQKRRGYGQEDKEFEEVSITGMTTTTTTYPCKIRI